MTRAQPLSFDDVWRVGLTLPDVEQGTAWGVPALRAAGKVLACVARHRSAEPDSLIVMLPVESREALIAEQPDVYYVTEHYVPHNCVVARLSRLRKDALRDLLLMGHRYVTRARVGRSTRT